MTREEKNAAEKMIKTLENFEGIYNFKAEDEAMDTVLYKLFSNLGFPGLRGDMATPKRNRAMIAFLQKVYIGGENIRKEYMVSFDAIDYEYVDDDDYDTCKTDYAYTAEEAIELVKKQVLDYAERNGLKGKTAEDGMIIIEDENGPIGECRNFRIYE